MRLRLTMNKLRFFRPAFPASEDHRGLLMHAVVGLIAVFTVSNPIPHAWAQPEASSISRLTAQLTGRDRTVDAFYRANGYLPQWNNANSAILRTALTGAVDEGLDPKHYLSIADGPADIRDVALTRAAIDYLQDLRQGRESLRVIDDDIALPPVIFDAASALNVALKSNALAGLFTGAAPAMPEYARLKIALGSYRAIDARGGWPVVDLPRSDVAALSDQQAHYLRERLAYEDADLPEGRSDLEAALKRFQGRHGLAQDGRVGKATLAELNVPAQARTRQIALNMERLRWLPWQLEADYILVNVPDAHLSLMLDGREVLASRVIVGKPKTPTPILRAEGGGITVNPPWNVPASIARNEILPKLKTNPSYLKSQDMVLLNGPPGDPFGLTVHWRAVPKGTFPYLIQQHPGANNPLGTVKLELPNKFDVYLHDTPAKSAFARAGRDLSHGCVRVEQILPLASYALSKSLDDMIAITDAISSGETRYLPLQRKLPVYFLYETTFVDANGAVQFRPDIYGRDRRMLDAETASAPVADQFRVACATASVKKG
jgi:L,D-transpeptidase YcbB